MEERRQCGRWQVNNLVSVKLQGQDHPLECKIEDVSLKGLRIHSPQELKKDSILALSIALDNELSLNIEASIAWNNTQGADNIYGFYFTKIKDIDKENIYRYVYRNFPEQIKQQVWKGVM
jgi:c-di-GMP-binding flagellar brake protein YcgR